ncbi:MAG: N-acetyltransferase [Hyphomonadaceae bacterium]|nr:N-acetyltransferase [Hyphomonadaceae bacterium]
MPFTLVAEKPDHAAAIEGVLNRAFGPGRFAKTSERVRERGAVLEPSLSRIAVSEAGSIVGVCRIWRVELGGLPLFFLGPLAVDPSAQNAGLGADLVNAAVQACRSAGGEGILVVGAASFFAPMGFAPVPEGRVTLPGPVDPARVLWLELRPGALSGVHGSVNAPRRG